LLRCHYVLYNCAMHGANDEKSDHNFRFRIRGWMEQVGGQDPKPAGSLVALAVQGLDLGTGSRRARKKRVLSQWPEVYRAFAPRIRQALGLEELGHKTGDLFTFLALLNFMYSAVGMRIGNAEDDATERSVYVKALRRLFQQTVPTGRTRGGVEFVASPDGLLLLSALFGLATGSLRACPRCWGFYTVPWYSHRQRLCKPCREKPRLSAHGLRSREASLLWRRVSHRMRARCFRDPQVRKLWGRTPREAYRRWRAQALPALRQTTDLKAWESRWSPEVRRGRPPKRAHAAA
jgi:hypothetical protein